MPPDPTRKPGNLVKPQPTIGIITALPLEHTAVMTQLDRCSTYAVNAKARYDVGFIASKHGGEHCVALVLLSDTGNNIASARATLLLEHFPSITSILMVGIAGGVPNPSKPDDHVRLGDIVVSNREGVVQYDFDKETQDCIEHRHPPRAPHPTLLEAARHLVSGHLRGDAPWITYIADTSFELEFHNKQWQRPADSHDLLADSHDQTRLIKHPKDTKRFPNQPRVFSGPIASANKLLKNPLKRDALRDKFGVKAVEMEGSGIADAGWQEQIGYLVIRGICDYCDGNKNDEWQFYAAIVAASYTKALIESMSITIENVMNASMQTDHLPAINAPNQSIHNDIPDTHSVLAVLSSCPDPFPVDVMTKCMETNQATLESVVADEISRGALSISDGMLVLQSRNMSINYVLPVNNLTRIFTMLLQYIKHNQSLPKGYSQVNNAIELAKRCRKYCPEAVAKSASIMDRLLKRKGNKKLVLDFAELAIECARAVKPREREIVEAEAKALICGKSWVYQRIDRLAEARTFALESLKLGEEIHWTRNSAFCKKCLGRLLRLEAEQTQNVSDRQELLEDSIASLRESIDLFTKLDDTDKDQETGDCYSLIGRTYLVAGDIVAAKDATRKAFSLLDDENDKDFLDLKILVGDIFRTNHEFEEALLAYNVVIEHHFEDDSEKTDMRARALYGRGLLRKSERKTKLAVADLGRALKIWQDLDDSRAAAKVECQLLELEGNIPKDIMDALKSERPLQRATALKIYQEKLASKSKSTLAQRDKWTTDQINRLKREAHSRTAMENPEW